MEYSRKDFSGNIKWTRSDIGKLSAAIRQFNKKIENIRTEENKNYLPSKIEYKNIKDEILTRSELNRMINSLNRFKKENAEKLYKTEAGETLTRWEKNELSFAARRIKSRITKELSQIELEGGQIRLMGDERVSNLKAQLENLKGIETKVGKDFERLKQRILEQGRSDTEYFKALVFKENYYKMIEGLKNFKNFDKFKEKLDSFKNPISLYKFLDQNELASDIQFMYDIGGKGVSKISTEERFDFILESLEII